MGDRLRVGILFGGQSGEHEVSLMSAASIWRAIDRERFDPVPIGIARDGLWLVPESFMDAVSRPVLDGIKGQQVALIPQPGHPGLVPVSGGITGSGGIMEYLFSRLDVVFPVLHGPMGEDGTIQGLLELAGVPYVGAGVAASAVGMDKTLMKEMFRSRGLPICKYLSFRRYSWETDRDRIREMVSRELGYPCFVKPANMGSSVGVSKVKIPSDLGDAIDTACLYDHKFLVEEFIAGREIEVSVLGNEEPEASVPGEIRPKREFYDYKAKYREEGSELIVPAPLTPAQEQECRRLAVEAFQAVDAEGLARVDFFLTGEGKVLVSEINTMPGFTKISMYPRLWEASGLSYKALITRLIELGLERYADRSRTRRLYDPDPNGPG